MNEIKMTFEMKKKKKKKNKQIKLQNVLYVLNQFYIGERGGLVVNASDSGSRGREFEPHSGQTVLCP